MKKKIVVVTGPTASGKSWLAVELAKEFNGEIISADSMQIYRGFDIGTAKITSEEMQGIKHHLIDIVEPEDDFSAYSFMVRAKAIIDDIINRQKLPIIAGGTGLYINSIVNELSFTPVKASQRVREHLEKLSAQELHDMLKLNDVDTAHKIDPNNKQRLIRAMEVIELTGQKYSDFTKSFRKENKDIEPHMICLTMNRERLYERINQRVDLMINKGFIEEVEALLNKGYDRSLNSMKAIGYRELSAVLEDGVELEDAVDKIKQFSRNYAKRQLTWFRRDDRYNWYSLDDFDNKEQMLQECIKKIKIFTQNKKTEV